MTTVQQFHGARHVDPAASRLRCWSEPGVLHVAGEVDRWTTPLFAESLIAGEADPCMQALDLTAVDFFSSAGVSCFVKLGWNGRPHVAIIASRAVRRVLALCDMEYLLGRHGWRQAYDGWRVRRYPAF